MIKPNYLEIKTDRIGQQTYLRKGPPLHLKKAVERFKTNNEKIVERNGRVWAVDYYKSFIEVVADVFSTYNGINYKITIVGKEIGS